ncbi:MAG TPA: glycosyltransferase, partial [Phycisphaerae bacterium]|nr:glycosyltransferase [Phycisphaerae bacterium]
MESYNNIRRYNAAIMGAKRGKAKNILYMARDWNLDGAERQLLYLVTGLNREAYTPIVLLDRPGALNASLGNANVQTHVLKLHSWRSFPEGMLRYPDAMRATLLARKLRVNLVHTSDFWQAPYANFIAARLGVPNIIHVRGPLSSRDVAKHGIARATAMIAIAQRYCDDLAAAGIPSEHMTLIDDAVDVDLFFPLAKENDSVHLFREKFGVDSRLAVGMAGRIDRFKRVVEFLELIAALPPGMRAKAHFFIVGEQCDSNRRARNDYVQVVRNKLEQLGLKQSVIFTGRSDDMPVVLNALD